MNQSTFVLGALRVEAIPPLRWLLIVATSYLVIFSRPLAQTSPIAALYVAGYLSTALLWRPICSLFARREHLIGSVILFDVLAVTGGLLLADRSFGAFFGLYFLVVLISMLAQNLAFVLAASFAVGLIHVSLLYAVSDPAQFSLAEYAVRLPFLFAVGLSVGHVAEQIRAAQREAFEAREREHLRGEFVSSVIHDLKSPLGVAQVMLEMLTDPASGPLNSMQTKFVRLMDTSIRQVLALAHDFLDASRIEAGQFEIHPTLSDLPSLVDKAVSRARAVAERNHIEIVFWGDEDLPPVEVDGTQIDRAVSNLLDNAIKYTPSPGRVAVTVGRTASEFLISVSDTGGGIGPSEASTIFRKYQRGRDASGVVGSGLGLFIVKAVAEAHDGSVDLASAPGKGTTVTMHIPASRARPVAAPVVH